MLDQLSVDGELGRSFKIMCKEPDLVRGSTGGLMFIVSTYCSSIFIVDVCTVKMM